VACWHVNSFACNALQRASLSLLCGYKLRKALKLIAMMEGCAFNEPSLSSQFDDVGHIQSNEQN
jgi:hypothetical protein